MKKAVIHILLAATFFFALPAFAQTAPASAATTPPAAATPAAPPVSGGFSGSLLFSPMEVAAIQQAEAGAAPGHAILDAGKNQVVIPARRVITLSGIVYRSSNDWVAWINGKKVTPADLLPEIVEINVERERVRLKWFDIGINGVISISLHPHQTYDIVTGVLLPG